tara:strand:- start:215 stop:385 length:171 start_codon:yes stop_codon:yes gene_type:complete
MQASKANLIAATSTPKLTLVTVNRSDAKRPDRIAPTHSQATDQFGDIERVAVLSNN